MYRQLAHEIGFVQKCSGSPNDWDIVLRMACIGLAQANKTMYLYAITNNVMKYLTFELKRAKSGAGQLALWTVLKSALVLRFGALDRHLKLDLHY